MRILTPGAPGPLIVPGALWRRLQRKNPSGAFPEFIQPLDEYYGKIKSTCAKVTPEELLRCHIRRNQGCEASASEVDPILLVAPKLEPIEISSDSDAGSDSLGQRDSNELSSTVEGRRNIQMRLLRRKTELNQLALEVDELNKLAQKARELATAR